MKIELSKISMPIKRAVEEMSVAPRGGGQSEATISMNLVPKFGLLGALMGVLMMKPMMRKIFPRSCKGSSITPVPAS